MPRKHKRQDQTGSTLFWIPFQSEDNNSTDKQDDSSDNEHKVPSFRSHIKSAKEESRVQKLIVKELLSLKQKANEAHTALAQQLSIQKQAFDRLSVNERVLLSDFPNTVKSWLLSRIHEADNMTDGGNRMKLIQYVENALLLPLEVSGGDEHLSLSIQALHEARAKMDEQMFGQSYLKDEILSILTRIVKADSGSQIAFAGPPGVGKTMAARLLIAGVLNVPFFQISCGGLHDAAILLGHSSTYVGAKSGQIAQIAAQCHGPRAVLVLDEVDKIASDAIWGVLTHILDKTQHNTFTDHYFGENIPIDLSKWIFVLTYNDESKINQIVRDRMRTIHVLDYSFHEKKKITSHHLLPKAISEFGLVYDPHVSDDIIDFLVKRGIESHKSGVRGCKMVCEALSVRLFLYHTKSENENQLQPYTLTINDIKDMFVKEDKHFATSKSNHDVQYSYFA